MTEVILKAKIEGLGAEADVVKVKPGYARNYLFPRNLAAPATKVFRQQVEQLKRSRAHRESAELTAANDLASKLAKMTLTFQMEAGQGSDKVFGSVTANDIAERLSKQKTEVDRKRVRLPHAIKELGEHTIEIHLHPEVNASLKVVLELSREAEAVLEERAKERERDRERERRPRRTPRHTPAPEPEA